MESMVSKRKCNRTRRNSVRKEKREKITGVKCREGGGGRKVSSLGRGEENSRVGSSRTTGNFCENSRYVRIVTVQRAAPHERES